MRIVKQGDTLLINGWELEQVVGRGNSFGIIRQGVRDNGSRLRLPQGKLLHRTYKYRALQLMPGVLN